VKSGAVGVNAFQTEEKIEMERLRVDPAIEEQQCERLRDLRLQRSAGKASELLSALEKAARGTDNLMPLVVECVENSITLGEICGVLRQVWGEYRSET
jgi:methylmalonyl-CoA mutase N-terminal domain/subunit